MKIIILAFLLFITIYGNAQSGEIMFTFHNAGKMSEMGNMEQGMSDDLSKQFAGLKARMSSSEQKLIFDEKVSKYVDISGEKIEELYEGGELQMKMMRKANLEEYFVTFSSKKYIHKREIFNKYFIIEEAFEHPKWKLVQEQKEILGLSCMKATLQDEGGNTVTAWYTMSIPHSIGPNTWGGLPGIILELEESIGGSKYVATSIDLDAKPEITKPQDGEKVSLKQFLKIEERKKKEFEEMGGGKMMKFEGF